MNQQPGSATPPPAPAHHQKHSAHADAPSRGSDGSNRRRPGPTAGECRSGCSPGPWAGPKPGWVSWCETLPSLSPTQNRVIELCGQQTPLGRADPHAAPLDALLQQQQPKLDLNTLLSRSGATPLGIAALGGAAERVRVLLKHGADPNVRIALMEETALHIAARYRFLAVVRVLLEAGANPLLLDGAGNTPLFLAESDGHMRMHAELAAPKPQVVALIREHVAKYEHHLRQRVPKSTKAKASSSSSSSGGPAGATSSASEAAAAMAAAAAAPVVGSKSCDSCGREPEPGSKLHKCSRCSLRAYCGKECQRVDWPVHKAPCRLVADIKAAAAEVMDCELPSRQRMRRATVLGDSKVAQQIALSLKALPQLVEAMPTDKLTEDGFLPTLQAAHLLMLLKDAPSPAPASGTSTPGPLRLDPVAVELFIAAGGPAVLLKALARLGVSDACKVHGLRTISCVLFLKAACKPLVKRGLATELVQLLPPFVTSGNARVSANSAFSISQLLRAEQHLLLRAATAKGRSMHKAEQQQGNQQGQELPPVLGAVLAPGSPLDLTVFVSGMGASARSGVNCYQACIELWTNLLHSKLAFEALCQHHEPLLKQVTRNAVCGIGLVNPQGMATNLETLFLLYKHGGVDFFAREVRRVLLTLPEDWDDEPDQPHRDMTNLQPGEQVMCRGLFVSCLLDCVEHDHPTVKLDTHTAQVWHPAALVLRACWDAVPELRCILQDNEFAERVTKLGQEPTRVRPPKVHEVMKDVLFRVCVHWDSCKPNAEPFPQQDAWLAAVRRDPSGREVLQKLPLGRAFLRPEAARAGGGRAG